MEISGQYLSYAEYQALGGTLTETPFKILEFEARQNVDKYTFGRLKELESQNEEVKLCIYKLIGMLDSYNSQETQNKAVSSESTDGYSISYQTPSKSLTEAKNSEIQSIVKEYLVDCKLEDGTPYMYCGADK
jgi:hypothetical protein